MNTKNIVQSKREKKKWKWKFNITMMILWKCKRGGGGDAGCAVYWKVKGNKKAKKKEFSFLLLLFRIFFMAKRFQFFFHDFLLVVLFLNHVCVYVSPKCAGQQLLQYTCLTLHISKKKSENTYVCVLMMMLLLLHIAQCTYTCRGRLKRKKKWKKEFYRNFLLLRVLCCVFFMFSVRALLENFHMCKTIYGMFMYVDIYLHNVY